MEAEPGRMGGNLSLKVRGKAFPVGGTACAEAGAEKRGARGLSLQGARASSRGMGRRGGACDETFMGDGGGGQTRGSGGGGREACHGVGMGGGKGCVQTLMGVGSEDKAWGQGRQVGPRLGRWWLVAPLTLLGTQEGVCVGERRPSPWTRCCAGLGAAYGQCPGASKGRAGGSALGKKGGHERGAEGRSAEPGGTDT